MKRILTIIAMIGAFILAPAAAAAATPDTGSGGASIDNASGPIDNGAHAEDGSGIPGPDYSTPAPKPSRGDFEKGEKGDSDYNTAVGLWQAGEAGRIANLAIQQSK